MENIAMSGIQMGSCYLIEQDLRLHLQLWKASTKLSQVCKSAVGVMHFLILFFCNLHVSFTAKSNITEFRDSVSFCKTRLLSAFQHHVHYLSKIIIIMIIIAQCKCCFESYPGLLNL
ncbi:hypothetical protein HS088_TW08G00900 [Tripterygium wilfordii]|uniref:Uncharacterized protein n=1 Tax=Tripterygium wilfordii TaxID=458696 RepID=A0A7J7DD59_TRIWF|nr:hypothetical protein HS088_TW08G00900 [Tripterygium wilfordii]